MLRTIPVNHVPMIVVLLTVLASISTTGAQTQSHSDGLDFVILVDVSTSMFWAVDEDGQVKTKEGGDGNDPQRLRWDAVKLVVDLLTEEDRILIIPFNLKAPAAADKPGLEMASEYSFLSQEWRQLSRTDERGVLTQQIENLIHSKSYERRGDRTFCFERGGTSILAALSEAKLRIEAERSSSKGPSGKARQVSILLLTDGRHLNRDDDPYLVEEAEWKESLSFFESGKIRIHTIALGNEAATLFLKALANKTAGSSWRARSSANLVHIFREMIWSLKDDWVWRIPELHLDPGTDISLTSKPLQGIIDLGVLCFEQDDQRLPAGNPRNSFPPQPFPRRSWMPSNLDAPDPKGSERTGKTVKDRNGRDQATDYAYFYYDGRTNVNDSLGQFFDREQSIELRLDFDEIKSPLTLFFVKRVAKLFEIIEPKVAARIYRHEPVPVVVEMQDSKVFRPELFELSARLGEGPEIPLDNRSNTRFFEGRLSPINLKSEEGAFDFYNLVVRVRGKNTQPPHALSNYQYDLARTIRIQNDTPLALTPGDMSLEVGTDKERDSQNITVKLDLANELPVSNSYAPVTLQIRALGLGPRFGASELWIQPQQTQPVPPAQRRQEYTLERLGQEMQILFQPESLQEVGGRHNYELVARGDGFAEAHGTLTLRVRGSITVDPDTIFLEAATNQSRDSAPVAVKWDLKDQPAEGTETVDLAIEPVGEDPFGPDELWIRHAGRNEPRLSSGLKLDEQVEIHFQPKDCEVTAGNHEYRLLAAGEGLEDVRGTLKLRVKYPIVFHESPSSLRVGSGKGKDLKTVTVTWDVPARPANIAEPVTVAIRPVDDGTTSQGPPEGSGFSTDELWLETASPSAVADKKHEQTILQTLGEPFEIHFWPKPRRDIVGKHAYELVAYGEEVDEERVALTLEVEPPTLELQPSTELKLFAKPGVQRSVRLQAKLNWLPMGEWEYAVQPVPKINFRGVNGQGESASFDCEYAGLDQTVRLMAPLETVGRFTGWSNYTLNFAVPRNAPFGKYQGMIEFLDATDSDESKPAATLAIQLVLNSLYLEFQAENSEGTQETERRRVEKEVFIKQFFGSAATLPIRVRTELESRFWDEGLKWEPGKLSVAFCAPPDHATRRIDVLQNDRGGIVAPPTWTIRSNDSGPIETKGDDGLSVDFHFPKRNNADPGVPYRANVIFKYGDMELDAVPLAIHVTFLDPRDIFVRQKTANKENGE